MNPVDIGVRFFGGPHVLDNTTGIGSVVSLILNIAFVAAGLILLIYIIIGGIGLISAAGKPPQDLEKSKKTISSALIGFIVVFAAYWIVKLIGQITGYNLLLP